MRVDFAKVKEEADFLTVLRHYGITAEGTSAQRKIRCPFHEDKRPSCSINLERKVFHCFGCGAKGNILDFVHRMEAERGSPCSIREAAVRLSEIAGGGTPTRREKREGGNKPLSFELKLKREHPYLLERVGEELAQTFGLGVAERGLMKGRLCIPIHDEEGSLVGYAGRYAGDPVPEGEAKYLLPQGFQKHLVLWNLHRVRHVRHLVVVEGFFGAIRLFAERIPAVALMGRTISPEQVELLRGCPNLTHVSVMLDGDEAGREAAPAVVQALAPHFWVREVVLPEGEQPDTVEAAFLSRTFRKKGQA